MPEPIVKFKDLEITYNLGKENEFKATKGATADIYAGEFIAFFGPSGCGKSTIMYSILGILEPSAGQLLVKGENPYTFSPEEMVTFQTRTIGIIYQAFFLINSISVIDNVALPQIFDGVSPGKRRKWAKILLERFGIGDLGEKYPDNLSGGQCQRVAVSRSMVNNPDILLADEPTGNLDSVSTKQVMEALATINRKDKKTVIIITHNAAQLSYCHRVFYFKDGKLQRIVPNPEKKQIAKIDKQKMLVTEMQRLAKIYPYLTPTDLKVKSIINYLTQDFDFDQILRMEDFTKLVVERKIDEKGFSKLLAKPFRSGGVGASPSLAKAMAEKVSSVLDQSEDAMRFRRRFMRNNFLNREKVLMKRLTEYIADVGKDKLTIVQKRRLKELVYKRIAGLVSKDEFQDGLNLSLEEGGLGLDKKTVRKMTLHYEKLLIQGSDDKGHEH
jgi:ABC-type lipoprotein export system ATPase subunit